MRLFKPQFSLRTMLFAVAVIALAAYSIREWKILRNAREQFAYTCAKREALQVTVEHVVLSSATLMEAETAAPWISERKSRQLHVERLHRLLKIIESPTNDSHPGEIDRHMDFVRREIGKFDSSPIVSDNP